MTGTENKTGSAPYSPVEAARRVPGYLGVYDGSDEDQHDADLRLCAREVLRLHQPDDALRLTVAQALHRDRGPIPVTPWDDLPVEAQWGGDSQALYLAYADTALAALRDAP